MIIETPKQLPVPVTADQLIEKLDLEAGTDDLLAWILSTNEDVELELAMQLFLNAIRKRSDSASPTDETKTYSRNQYETEAVRWIWRNKNGASDERVSPKTRRSVSTA